jgi:hypothetical protein
VSQLVILAKLTPPRPARSRKGGTRLGAPIGPAFGTGYGHVHALIVVESSFSPTKSVPAEWVLEVRGVLTPFGETTLSRESC